MLLFGLLLNAIFSMVALYIFNKTDYITEDEKRTFFEYVIYYIYRCSLVVLTLVPVTSCLIIHVRFFAVITNIAILNLVLISIVLTIKKNIKLKNE